ncbi:AI-2E family transporter, partial [Zunongwangia sp. F297]|nr:AI-2E family transporter [Zunongwangia sp. F297]
GVVVGVPLFGFIGLIFGPILISLFLLILKIYKKEYGNAHDRL